LEGQDVRLAAGDSWRIKSRRGYGNFTNFFW